MEMCAQLFQILAVVFEGKIQLESLFFPNMPDGAEITSFTLNSSCYVFVHLG